MKNLFFLVLGLFLLVPTNGILKDQYKKADGVVDVELGEEWAEYFEGSLELFTFDYHQHILLPYGGIVEGYGKAFIADGKIITAEHLTVYWNDFMRNDLAILGDSPIHGLDICSKNHGVGDKFYYRTRHDGVKHFTVTHENGNNYHTVMDESIRNGESGSPVICEEHRGVVALVTSFVTGLSGQHIGIITKVPIQQYK